MSTKNNFMMTFVVKILNGNESINSAKRLLYDIYIGEMEWAFRRDSPTGFRVDRDEGNHLLLCDVFDDSSIWFGAYEGGDLIGVMRAVQRSNPLGKLDLELYPASKLPSMKRIFRENENYPLVEVQRGAVAKRFRDARPSIIQRLVLHVFRYALKNGLSVVCPTVFPRLEALFTHAGMRLIETNFTYEEGSQECPTSIFYSPSDELGLIVERLKNAARKRRVACSFKEHGEEKRSKFLVV